MGRFERSPGAGTKRVAAEGSQDTDNRQGSTTGAQSHS